MASSFGVVGYEVDGTIYCVGCFTSLDRVCDNTFFLGDETDSNRSCDSCLDLIESSVITNELP